MKKKYKIIPPIAWGPGCYVDLKNNRLYGADGIIYDNVQINRADLDRLIEELKQKEKPQ